MDAPKKQNTFACDHFDFQSANFDFTRSEMAFVMKYLNKRYPTLMTDFIDSARELMAWIQQSSSTKLYYEIQMTYNPARTRYISRETLYVPSLNAGQYPTTVLSIEPIPRKRREQLIAGHIRPIEDIAHMMTMLGAVQESTNPFHKSRLQANNLSFGLVVDKLLQFLRTYRKQLNVYYFQLVPADPGTGHASRLRMELGHLVVQSYMFVVEFELC